MMEIIRKNEYQFVCVLDNATIQDMLNNVSVFGNDIDRIMTNARAVNLLLKQTIDVVSDRYKINAGDFDIDTSIYKTQTDTCDKVVMNISMKPYDANSREVGLGEIEEEVYEVEYETVEESDLSENELAAYSSNTFRAAYSTTNIENIISMQQSYRTFSHCEQHSLYHLNGAYIIYIDAHQNLDPGVFDDVRSMLVEYMSPLYNCTKEYLDEYGKFITSDIPSMVDTILGA